MRFPLTFASAQQHWSIVKRRRNRSASAPAAAPLRLHSKRRCSDRSAAASPGFFLPINRDRGRCPSLCHPGFYYGGVSIPQSLLASHPLSVAFGDHQRCHRPRGTGKASALFVLFRWAVRTACLLAAANDVNILIASLWDVSTTAAALVYFIFSHHSSTVTPIILPLFSQIRRSVCAVASASLAGNWIHWIHFNIHYLGKRNSHLWSPAPPPQFLSLRPPK